MHLNELDFNQLDDALTSARFNEHTPKQIDDALAVLRGLRGSVITDQDMDLARDGVWKSGRNRATAHPMCIEAADAIERLEADNARLRDAVADIPQPYEYLSAADLKLVRPFIDALRTWRHKHTAALKG